MKIQIWLAAVTLLALVASCRRETPTQLARKRYDEMQMAYCTNSLRVVEKVLLDYLNTLSEQESNHVRGLDYDMCRALTHERLFLIYRKTGETNTMHEHFKNAMESLRRHNSKFRIPPPDFTYETLAEMLEKSERGIDVKWKKE